VARERRASGGICAAVRPASITAAAVIPALYLHRASPSPALAICTHPGHWRGGAGAPNIRGHLRGSAPGQHHGGSGHPGAVPAPCQPVTRPRDLHPSRTLARWLNIKIKYAVTRRKKAGSWICACANLCAVLCSKFCATYAAG
ncbi:hypothetical protein ACI5JN_005009, partial [Salmonella enterica]